MFFILSQVCCWKSLAKPHPRYNTYVTKKNTMQTLEKKNNYQKNLYMSEKIIVDVVRIKTKYD